MKTSIIFLWIIVIALVATFAIGHFYTPESKSFGGVTVGNEYTSTSTIHSAITSNQLIREGWGSLGSVVITGAGTSAFTLYDATSTDFSTNPKRSTSTALLATIPASLAAGTYTFDVTYTTGLFVYYDTVATAVTSTITYR